MQNNTTTKPMENRQTAVMQLLRFILVERRQDDGSIKFHAHEDFSRFLQMEKEQIKDCWDVAHQAGRFEGKGIAEENWQTFEQYYNETYGK